MKCKVGDLAWYVYPNAYKGWLMEVVSGPVSKGQLLPCGFVASVSDDWVIRSINGGPFFNHTGSVYASASDSSLDPIRPPKITETETTDELEGVL